MKDNFLPAVTVIAPCRNEAAFIKQTINTILGNDYPQELVEFLVVDGMSTDGTREIVSEIAAQNSRVKLLDNPDRIVPTAMNIGLRASKGEYVIRIDCHCHFAPDYIRKCVEIAERTNADNVGGYIETVAGSDTNIAKAIAAATSSKFGVGNSAFRVGGKECEVDTVPFGTFRKTIFEKIGYYDERLVRNQDIELNSRIRKAGGKIIISPEIKLKYYNRATYRGIWQQAFNNGQWNPYTIWLVGSGLQLRHFIPMFFVLSIIVLGLTSMLYRPFIVLFAVDLLLYITVATYYAIAVGKKKDISIIHILWAYFALHIAYGLGSLWGVLTFLIKFPNPRRQKAGKSLADRM